MSKGYLILILLLMLVFPAASVLADHIQGSPEGIIALTGKWFTFWGLGMRLAIAGLKQVLQPAFTAKEIFHIEDKESQIIVRELGFANLCIGTTGILSLLFSSWRIAAAFAGGLYMGIAGINHIIKNQPAAMRLPQRSLISSPCL